MSGEFKAVVLEDLCRSCGACVSMCPSRAITLEGADRADLDRMLSGALGEGTG
jgi:ferredoxin